VFTLPGFDASKVNTIMMQATPNQYPGKTLAKLLVDYITSVN